MGAHIVNGRFQSDKYPMVPLKVTDKDAQRLLWAYAQAHRPIDPEFTDDLEIALFSNGFVPTVDREARDMAADLLVIIDADRAAVRALVATLPHCPECGVPATIEWVDATSDDGRVFCDDRSHWPDPDGRHADEFEDGAEAYPLRYAEALSALLAQMEPWDAAKAEPEETR